MFFPVLREVILEDGRIGQDEEFYLLKMLHSNGHVRPSEKRFLQELAREAREVPAEFETLCEEAFTAHPTNWDVGGR